MARRGNPVDQVKQTASNDNVEATPISVAVTDDVLLRAAASAAAGPTFHHDAQTLCSPMPIGADPGR
jgi:hypothetical protein